MSSKLITKYDYVEIRRKISFIRESTGLNKRQFALSIGIQPSYMVELENGNRKPSMGFLEAFCSQYEISLNWLLMDFGAPYLREIDNKTPAPRNKDHRLLVRFLDHWWQQYERKPRMLQWLLDKFRRDVPEFADWEEAQYSVKTEPMPSDEPGTN